MSSSSPSACSTASPETEGGGGGRKYKGVRLRKWGKWVAEIRLPNSRERIWLGSHDAPEKAARAFDAAFVCLRGHQAAAAADALNFPDSPPPPCRHSADPQEVQAAALSHANRAPVMAREAAAALIDVCSPSAATLSIENCFSTHQGHGLDIFGGEVVAPDGSIDWSTVIANQPPLFSPTAGWGSNAYDYLLAPPLGLGDNDMQMEESDDGATASLWSFDPSDSYIRY